MYPSYLRSESRGSNKKQSRPVSGDSDYIEISSDIHDVLAKRDSIIKEASDLVARYAVKRGQHATSSKGVKEEISGLLRGFSVEEQQAILMNALTSVIVNM